MWSSFLIKVLAEFKNFYEDVKDRIKEIGKKIDAIRRERTKGQMLFIEDKEILELEEKWKELKKEIDEIEFFGNFCIEK